MSMMGNGVQVKVHVVYMCLATTGGETMTITKYLTSWNLFFMTNTFQVFQFGMIDQYIYFSELRLHVLWYVLVVLSVDV